MAKPSGKTQISNNGVSSCYVMLCYVMLCYVMLCYVMALLGDSAEILFVLPRSVLFSVGQIQVTLFPYSLFSALLCVCVCVFVLCKTKDSTNVVAF